MSTARVKFYKGDRVKIADDLGPCMRHFQSGVEAIVVKRSGRDYSLKFKDGNVIAWYEEHQLTLVAPRKKCPCCKQVIIN